MTLRIRFRCLFLFIVLVSVLIACSRGEHKVKRQEFEQKYSAKKIILGSFDVHGHSHYGSQDPRGIYWMTMSRGGLAIDDSGVIYVLASEGKAQIYNQDGKYTGEIVLHDSNPKSLRGPIEVSAAGSSLYVGKEENKKTEYRVFNTRGDFMGSNGNLGFLWRSSCKDVFYGETSDKGEKTEMYALDSNFNRVKDIKTYYLPHIKLNEKPVGFFDTEWNYYYMWYWPKVTKLGASGNVLWEKEVPFKGSSWQLIGIDGESNLYAVTYVPDSPTKAIANIVKMNRDLKVMASIPLDEEMITGLLEDTPVEVHFVVTCDGNVYFIPNHLDAINPAFEEKYREYRRKGEYAIYKFEKNKVR